MQRNEMCVLGHCRVAEEPGMPGPVSPASLGVCVGTSQALLVAVTSIFSPMLDSEH